MDKPIATEQDILRSFREDPAVLAAVAMAPPEDRERVKALAEKFTLELFQAMSAAAKVLVESAKNGQGSLVMPDGKPPPETDGNT